MSANLKQSELSEEMCISEEMMSKIERGVRMCTPDNMSYLCKKFNKSADYFFFGTEREEYVLKTKMEIILEIQKILRGFSKEKLIYIYRTIKVLEEELG